jgi:hypothetical protein
MSLAVAKRCCATVGVIALLAACSAPPPPPPVVAGPPPPPVPIDGTYNGIMRLAQGGDRGCGTQDVITLQVSGHAFSYVLQQPQIAYLPTRTFNLTIAPDGSFQTMSGAAFMRGKVAGGHMQGEIVGDACGYRFEADSTGTM